MKATTLKTQIKLKELEKIDIRVGTIISVEDIEKSDKLVRLTVDNSHLPGGNCISLF